MINYLEKIKLKCRFIVSMWVFLSIYGQSLLAEESDPLKDNQIDTKKTAIQETVLGMNVSGNKEAPNILYIIPWKDSTEHSKPPEINLLMDEVFSTLDPDVYEKELGFYQQLTKANATQETDAKE